MQQGEGSHTQHGGPLDERAAPIQPQPAARLRLALMCSNERDRGEATTGDPEAAAAQADTGYETGSVVGFPQSHHHVAPAMPVPPATPAPAPEEP